MLTFSYICLPDVVISAVDEPLVASCHFVAELTSCTSEALEGMYASTDFFFFLCS